VTVADYGARRLPGDAGLEIVDAFAVTGVFGLLAARTAGHLVGIVPDIVDFDAFDAAGRAGSDGVLAVDGTSEAPVVFDATTGEQRTTETLYLGLPRPQVAHRTQS
jgi:hypothetical protein